MNTATTYSVLFTYHHDRPELRGPSYGPVAKGTRVQHTLGPFPTQKRALGAAAELVGGEWDDPAGFVSLINVKATRGDRQRWVKAIGRTRNDDGSVVVDPKRTMGAQARFG